MLLIRHGLNDAVGRRITGWLPGWPLNAEGRRQVEDLSQRLAGRRIQAVYASPLERARETAEAVARPHGVPVRVEDQLGEMRVGEWEGLTFEELAPRPEWQRFNRARSTAPVPGGDMMIETQARMVRCLERLSALHQGETVAVVSHADPLRAALAHYLGIPLDLLQRFEISPASVSVVEMGETPRVLCMNHQGDLPV